MNITLIASDNGLGHIRRVIYLSNALSSKNNVNLLIPKNANKKFKINKNIKVINFKMNLNVKKKKLQF